MSGKTPFLRMTFLRLIIVVIVLGVLMYWIVPTPFGSSSICGDCGYMQYSQEQYLPFSNIKIWESEEFKHTRLSKSSVINTHAHQWIFMHGSGNGIACALGGGNAQYSVAVSHDVVLFLEAVDEFDGRDAADEWRNRFMKSNAGGYADMWLELSRWPKEGFSNEDQFHRWVREAEISGQTFLTWIDNENFAR